MLVGKMVCESVWWEGVATWFANENSIVGGVVKKMCHILRWLKVSTFNFLENSLGCNVSAAEGTCILVE